MEWNDAKKEIRQRSREVLDLMGVGYAKQNVNGEASYICPLCGHGKGGDGMAFNPKSRDGNGLKCFGCGFGGDVIDLWLQVNAAKYSPGETGKAIRDIARALNIAIDDPQAAEYERNKVQFAGILKQATEGRETDGEQRKGEIHTEAGEEMKHAQNANDGQIEARDFSAQYEGWQAALEASTLAQSFLTGRGISMETARRAGMGYDAALNAVVMPVTKGFYSARLLAPANGPKAINPRGAVELDFSGCYSDPAPVFVVEGMFDALSLMESGRKAIALFGAGNGRLLVDALKSRKPVARIILAFDSDDAGRHTSKALLAELQGIGVNAISQNICGLVKDPNDALTANKETFMQAVQAAVDAAPEKACKSWSDGMVNHATYDWKKGLKANNCRIATGYENLDAETGGGLKPGLHCLAAIPSLGKTTFALQMATQMAEQGQTVIFFSLEQSRLELIVKQYTHLTEKAARANLVEKKKNDGKTFQPSTGQNYSGITNMKLSDEAGMQEGEREQVESAVARFAANCPKQFFSTDEVDTIKGICERVDSFIEERGERPVVFIDYLQLIRPDKDEQGDSLRENIDNVVRALHELIKKHHLSIIVISSMNRQGYKTAFAFESLKESGGIEYGSDVVWGLQLRIMKDGEFQRENDFMKETLFNRAKADIHRRLELQCVKNRSGRSTYTLYFDYNPEIDTFFPVKGAVMDNDDADEKYQHIMRRLIAEISDDVAEEMRRMKEAPKVKTKAQQMRERKAKEKQAMLDAAKSIKNIIAEDAKRKQVI